MGCQGPQGPPPQLSGGLQGCPPPAEGYVGPTHRLEEAQVVSEGSQHANEGDDEHDDPQEDEDDGWGQKGTFEGFIFLPLHLCVDPHRQDQGSNQLQQESRE